MKTHRKNNQRLEQGQYDAWTVRLHWLTAVLVVALWVLGQTIDWFPRGLPRTSLRSVHITLGFCLMAALVGRIGWRMTKGHHLPRADRGWSGHVAAATHVLLYVLLCVTVALGVANAWIRGDTLFKVVSFPAYDPSNEALRHLVETWHEWSANTLLIVAGFHAAAGLFHHWILKDRVLQRMTGKSGGTGRGTAIS